MKTLQALCLFLILSAPISCKKDTLTQPDANQHKHDTLPDTLVNNAAADRDTIPAGNTKFKWIGKYSGNLPCGDCAGIKTEITLNADKTYTLVSQYTGKGKPVTYNGTYFLDEATQVATLDAEGDHLKFKIIDDGAYGMLKKLDKFGADEQGGPAARYLLHKVQ